MEFKAKDIEGFLLDKIPEHYRGCAFYSCLKPHQVSGYAEKFCNCGKNERNETISEQGEKVLVIELCDCVVSVFKRAHCGKCKGNGFTVRGGNVQHESGRKVAE